MQQQQQQHAVASAAIDQRSNTLIQTLLQACKKCTIDIEGSMENSIKTVICICTKSVDKKKLVMQVSNNLFVDWQYLQTFYAGASFGEPDPVPGDAQPQVPASASDAERVDINLLGSNTATWLHLADYLSFSVTDGMQEALLRRNYPPLWCIYNSLRESRVLDHTWVQHHLLQGQAGSNSSLANRSSKLNFNDVCKLCLLHNIESLPCRNIIEQYILQRLDRNQHTVAANILSALADQRNSSDVYFTTTRFLMGIMRVDTVLLGAKISHYKKSVLSQQQAWVVKFVQAGKSRPSMRDVLNRVASNPQPGLKPLLQGSAQRAGLQQNMFLNSAPSSTSGPPSVASSTVQGPALSLAQQQQQQQGGLTTLPFDEFCRIVRFPNSMSRLLRLRCYLLASHSHLFDFREKTGHLVSSDVARSINSIPVVFPDHECLRMGIETLTLRMRPFEQLNQFRQRCFVSFSINQQKVLNLTQILHLYVAAYQKPDVWKQVWKGIFPVMSTQISRDVENFVATTKFAVDEFIYLLKNSTPFVG